MRKQTDGKINKLTKKPMRLTKRIGQTTYKVNVHFNETSKETMSDKIMRLIKSEAADK